jgi:hypothetical protein
MHSRISGGEWKNKIGIWNEYKSFLSKVADLDRVNEMLEQEIFYLTTLIGVKKNHPDLRSNKKD